MIEHILEIRLRPVIAQLRRRRAALRGAAALGAAAAAGFGLAAAAWATSWSPGRGWTALAMAAAAAAAFRVWRPAAVDAKAAARRIEAAYPDLDGALLTAVEQKPGEGGGLNFLQHRLLASVVAHSQRRAWRAAVPPAPFAWMLAGNLVAAALCVLALTRQPGAAPLSVRRARPALPPGGVEVTPGDASVEKGSSLVVLARFGGALPPGVELVVEEAQPPGRRLPLTKSLADPVFGGSVPGIQEGFNYHIEYSDKRTKDFRVKVYEHPRLERADASLTFPGYTGQAPKRVEDTRRISAVEGTRLDLALQLNKPVASATLAPRKGGGAPIQLTVASNQAGASLRDFALLTNASFELRLVDADGRTNKAPAFFVFEALPNRTPEIRVASPQGDSRPSPLEEVAFSGTVWDDFGVPRYGLAFTLAGGETKSVVLGGDVKAREKRPFQHLLRLEELGVHPGQLLSWYAWADDVGADGQVRRTSGDLYFAEVRPFDEIFRESQGGDQQQQEGQQGQQGAQGNPQTKLADLEKQILSATWGLARKPPGAPTPQYRSDAGVVRDSQAGALEQAATQAGRSSNPRAQAQWATVTKEMEEALKRLSEATNSPAALSGALAAEQAAYQALLTMAAREHQVSRQRGGSRGQGQGGQASQRQIDELDLKQSDRRYETQRQATAPQSVQQREQLQSLSRLQELARRQQDLNEKFKELQTALAEARTPAEREERRRELKRLEEEQRQMVADADELRQRLDRSENQTAASDQRRQLDQTRDQLQQAADAASQGAPGQAAAAGARAQQQLQQLRDDVRKQSSGQFAEDLRDLRSQARELSRRQEELSKDLENLEPPGRRTLSDSDEHKGLMDQLGRQQARMTNLLDRAGQISELAETAEPLLAERLYDTLRKFSQDDGASVKRLQEELARRGQLSRSANEALDQAGDKPGAKSLSAASEMVRQGLLPQAGEAGKQARTEIEELKRGVERAAESVIGDDTESLRQAEQELAALTDELRREITRQQGGEAGPSEGMAPPHGDAAQPDPSGRNGDTAQTSAQRPGAAGPQGRNPGRTPGESPSPGGAQPGAQAQDRNQAQGQARGGQGRGGARQGAGEQGLAPGEGQAGAQPASEPGSEQSGEQASARQGAGQGGRQGGGRQTGGRAGGGRGGEGAQSRELADGRRPGGSTRGGGAGGGGVEGGGAAGGGFNLDRVLDQTGPIGPIGPLTGENFAPWSDRLRDAEQRIDEMDLRNQVATARDRARVMRLDFKRNGKKPDWTVVQLQVIKPLVEARDRIADELARRDSKESLTPIDRDPAPVQFTELVRRYFEELGKDKNAR